MLESANSQVSLLTKLIDKPVIINHNNTSNNYTVQFNALFSDLDVFNDENVEKSIKEFSSDEHIAGLEYNDIKQSVINALVTNSINKFAFFTDIARKTLIIKDTNNEKVKTQLDDFLVDYISYGNKEIRNYVTRTTEHIDELVNNDLVPDDTWYNYEKSRNDLLEQLSQTEKSNNPKNTELLKVFKTKLLADDRVKKLKSKR